MNEPIFDSVEVALGAAFRAEVDAVYPKSGTAVALNAMMKTSGWVFDDYRVRRIDTRGLRPLEYFAQCALVREVVESRKLLTLEEIYAIWARYAWGYKKELGYAGVAKHVESLTSNAGECLLNIVRSIYQGEKIFSERALAQKYGCSRSSIHVDRHKVISADYSLHALAVIRLDGVLKNVGVVGELVVY